MSRAEKKQEFLKKLSALLEEYEATIGFNEIDYFDGKELPNAMYIDSHQFDLTEFDDKWQVDSDDVTEELNKTF